ncbi:HD domain-containing protein [Cumulibacter manganitolerans]|uniref:HD domain-containing protein n=1 Tax=Cumulibacter manganitolerans TaxID=1884992 RepID=UPI001297445A|nr:metal-dependent phosphohydrolase [Cumulibacter manganitolerans]
MTTPRLEQLWTPYAGDTAAARAEWASLIDRWSEPHRAYHTLEHLLLMLELLAAHGADAETMLAAWYHDAVYDPRSSTNEADSAALAARALGELGLGRLAERVSGLVLRTAGHDGEDLDEQTALLLDADLAILGQPPAIYLRYVEGVRREYAHVPDAEFRTARSAVMAGFLDRGRIYRTAAFAALEPAARANIAAELALYDAASG